MEAEKPTPEAPEPTPEAPAPTPEAPAPEEAPSPEDVPPRVQLGRRDTLILLGGLLLLSVLFRWSLDGPNRWHNVDEGLWTSLAAFYTTTDASFAEVLLLGGDRPFHLGIYVLCDKLFGHYNLPAIGVAHSLLVGLTAWCLALLGAYLMRVRKTWLLFAIGAAYVLQSYTLYEGQVNNSEHAASLFSTAFLVVWVLGEQRRNQWIRWAAFLILGCAFHTKKQLAPLVVCAPIFWALFLRPDEKHGVGGLKGFAKEMAGSAAFFFVPWVFVALCFSLSRPHGLLDKGSVSLVFSSKAPPEGRWVKTYNRLHIHLGLVPVMFTAAVASMSVYFARPQTDEEREGLRPLRLLAAPFLLTLVATILGFHLYSHYFLLALPLGVVISAAVIQQVVVRKVLSTRVLVAVIVSVFFVMGPVHWLSLNRGDNPNDVAVGAWLKTQVEPEERIFVWGWAPNIYMFSERIPSTRHVSTSYLANDFHVEGLPAYDPHHMQTLLADLERYPPELIVVPLDMFWAFDAKRYELDRFPPLKEFIDKNYRLFAKAYRHQIYKKR